MVCSPFFPSPFAVLRGAPKSFQEAVVWKHAKHPNIVPFLGVTSAPFQLVSDWMSGGNLMEYIHKHPGTDRLALVCFSSQRGVHFSSPVSCSVSLRL